MNLRETADGRSQGRSQTQHHASTTKRRARKGRHARMWVAASSIVALLLMGASPALAEGDDTQATAPAAAEQPTAAGAAEESAPPQEEPAARVAADAPQTEAEPPAEPAPEPESPPASAPTEAPPAAPAPTEQAPAPQGGTGADGGSSSDDGSAPGEQPSAGSDGADAAADGNGGDDAPPAPRPAPDEPSKRAPAVAESAEPQPPYLHWRVVDESGALVEQSGLRVAVQGPNDAPVGDDELWIGTSVMTVPDNTGQSGYVGADLDARAGYFTVKQLSDDSSPERVHDVAVSEQYRVRPAAAEGFAIGEDAEWFGLSSVDDAAGAQEAESTPAELILVTAVEKPQESGKALGEGEPAPLLIDAPEDLEAPFVYWNLERADGTPLPGATFQIAAGTGTSGWGSSVNVPDCVAADSASCTGIDRDPDPGEFQVRYLATNGSNPVVAGNRYRVTQSVVPSGYLADSVRGSGTSGWQTVAAGAWNDGAGADTHDFGTWVNLATVASGSSRIIVKAGSDRTGASSVAGLAGVVMHLRTGNASGPSSSRADGVAGDGAGWARCVSDANGDCSFNVPNTGGTTGNPQANRDARFWVVQHSVPSGWYASPALRTGSSSGSGSSTDYRFRTGTQLRSGNTYTSTTHFMSTESGATASSGIWQQSRTNPTFPQGCGVDVALVLDLSGSVGGSVGALKGAADAFTNALVGTQSRMALFTFAYTSPKSGTSNYPTLTSVATTEQANAFKARYAGWSADGGTNWDRGLAVPAANNTGSNHYQVVVVITDGNPTNFGTGPSGSGSDNRFIEVEQGIFSANQLKAQGSRILVFGVGAGATGANNSLNLKAISGPVPYNGSNASTADYYQTSDYAAVGAQLKALAQGSCAGNMTVTKKVVPNTAPPGSIAGASPAVAGWTFTASNPGAGLAVPNPVQVTKADGTGTVTFPLTFGPGVQQADLTVAETQQSGYTLVPVGGKNAVCTNTVTGADVGVTNDTALGFRLTVPSSQLVNCVVYNRAPDLTSTVQVNKTWVLNDGTGEPQILDGNAGELPSGLSAQLKLSGPGSTVLDDWGWGTVRANYPQNSSARIFETVTIDDELLPGCEIVSQEVTEWNKGPADFEPVSIATDPFVPTLATGPNVFEVTNTVTCEQTLELVKVVDFGDEDADAWTLSASSSAAGALPGPSGEYTAPGSVKRPVTIDAAYALTESDGPATYVPTAAGWACVRQNGQSIPLVEGAVAVPLGQEVTCTVHNTTAKLTVFKNVDGGSASPSSWNITGEPASGVSGLAQVSWPGASSPASGAPSGGTTVEIRPDHGYTLSESLAEMGTPLAYLLTNVQRWDAEEESWVEVSAADLNAVPVTVAAGEHDFYRFVNTIAPSVQVPLTGGVAGDLYTRLGISLAAVAAALGSFIWWRTRRQPEVRR